MKREENNFVLLKRIREIKGNHPFWEYRRVWSYLKYRENLPINKKRIYRLMQKHKLMVKKNMRLKACRTPLPSKPKPTKSNEIWGIDMTKIMVPSWGWLYLVIVLDWYTKKIVGYDLSTQSKSPDWQCALNKAVNQQFPQGVRKHKNLSLVSDNGCQPTSESFMKACHTLRIKQIFTSYNNPKGNADTERVIRTLKEDLIWPYDWQDPFDLQKGLDKWIDDYNNDYPHSSLKNKTPCEFEKMCALNTY